MDREYQIVIKNETAAQQKSPIAADQNQSDTEKGKGLLSKSAAKTFMGGMVAYGTVKSFATQIVNHEVSMVQLRTGSKEEQDRANFTRDMVMKGLSIVEAGTMAALVTGNVLGFVAGAGIAITQQFISYSRNQDRINTQRTLENQSIQLNYIRAGARGSRGAL